MGQTLDHRNRAAIARRRQSVFEFSNGTGCLSNAFRSTPHVQAITHFDTGHYLFVNDNFVRAAGYPREEVIGKTSSEIGILADKLDRRWLTQVLRQHGRLDSRKVRFRLRSGDVRMGLFNAEVIKVDGEDCILSTVRDITQQIAAEDLHRQKSLALDLVHDAVVAVDPRGHITYLNRAARQFYGWTPEEVIGREARSILCAENKLAFDEAWRTLEDHGEWCGEITQRTKSGAEHFIESRWSAMRDDQSRITSILMVSTNVSGLNETAAGLAHEIRNPLASIKGVADAFLQRGQLTRQEREWMEAVRREVLKIDARMRELLDVSQPRVFNVRQCSLSELVGGVVQLAKHQVNSIKDRNVSVEFVDATTELLLVTLDPARIEDAVLNLILNAIEAIEGNGRVTVRLRCASKRENFPNANEALIEVSDTGCGIPVENRNRIFEPLFTTKREGTGLGLAAVKRTAAAYHGRITYKTRIGRGSKFVLALPLGSQPSLNEILK